MKEKKKERKEEEEAGKMVRAVRGGDRCRRGREGKGREESKWTEGRKEQEGEGGGGRSTENETMNERR